MKHYVEIEKDLLASEVTDDILNKLLPLHAEFIQNKTLANVYIRVDFQHNQLESITKLNSILANDFGFPPIIYYLIFIHDADQPIHVDGSDIQTPRFASLNLTVQGFETTYMNFYQLNNVKQTPRVDDALYFEKEHVSLDKSFKVSKKWALVNSSIPHNITGIDRSNPKITLCLRFKTNPKIYDLYHLLNLKTF